MNGWGDDDVTNDPGHPAVESHDADVDGFHAVVTSASHSVGGEETTDAFRLRDESDVFAQLCDGSHHAVVGADPVADRSRQMSTKGKRNGSWAWAFGRCGESAGSFLTFFKTLINGDARFSYLSWKLVIIC